MKLHILGCYSATLRSDRNPTAQVLELGRKKFLIDCGEGTQFALKKQKIKFSKIDHIFISHLHGDHFFGLIGLISTYRVMNRERPLHVYGPKGIAQIIQLQLELSESIPRFNLVFHELEKENSETIFEDDQLSVNTIPLKHRSYANGYLFAEKGKNSAHPSWRPKSYAFCSDTAYSESIAPIIKGVDVLYHESTFLEHHADKAQATGHSTAMQAAQIARLSNVKRLILGHFSSRYDDLGSFLLEAKNSFQNVQLADDGKTFEF